ncbi:MAG: HutD family protein [Alphaproteobacteria bacterium]|nr:HutD family protein [Alphaproteobacteria bacterium]
MIERLDPSQYKRTPWKNGGGTTTTIAEQSGVWQLGRTPIVQAGPFSDYSGFDRLQVLVAGRGLVLKTPDGEIDVRTPFRPVRFAGEAKITSQLEAGPVEVVNLIGLRAHVRLGLAILTDGEGQTLGKGTHFVYCPEGTAEVAAGSGTFAIQADHGLRIADEESTMLSCRQGRVVVASVVGV